MRDGCRHRPVGPAKVPPITTPHTSATIDDLEDILFALPRPRFPLCSEVVGLITRVKRLFLLRFPFRGREHLSHHSVLGKNIQIVADRRLCISHTAFDESIEPRGISAKLDCTDPAQPPFAAQRALGHCGQVFPALAQVTRVPQLAWDRALENAADNRPLPKAFRP